MDKIIKFINNKTNNKYKDLLFFGAELNAENSTMQICFSGLDKTEKSKENLDEIEVLCKEYLKGFHIKNIAITFRSNSLTMQEFKDYVVRKILSNDEFKNIDASKIDFDFLDDRVLAVISYQEGSLNENVIQNEKQSIESELCTELKQDVELVFNVIKTDASLIESRKERIVEDNYIFEEMKKNQYIELQNVEPILGDFNKNIACLAGDIIDDGSSEYCVVGNVSFCGVRERKNKTSQINEQDENSADEDQKSESSSRKYMVIELEYDGNKTRCVWFIPKNAENVDLLSTGEIIAICGKVNEFNDVKSINVSIIAKCTFTPPQKVWRKCPETYRYVKPEPYEFTEQTGFFFEEKMTDKKYLLDNTFVVYDLETTGINPEICKIIDIGAFKIVNGKIVEKFCTFVNPECEIPAEASKVNRITNQMVENCPTIEMVLPDFYKFCYGSTIVGYNNIGFDDLFITKESKKQFYNFDKFL